MSRVEFDVVKTASENTACLIGKKQIKALPEPVANALKNTDELKVVDTLGLMGAPKVAICNSVKGETTVELRRRFGKVSRLLSGAEQVSFTGASQLGAKKLKLALLGLSQGSYSFTRYMSQSPKSLQKIEVSGLKAAEKKAVQQAQVLADSVDLARDLINIPAEDMGPDQFVDWAKKAARESGLKAKVLSDKECEKLGMGALLGVGRASHRKPRLLILDWKGGRGKGFSALCGKGVCFDTGGLGLKPAAGMLLMKKDMGGAATVLAAMRALALLKVKKNIRAYIPLVENAVGPDSFRPGDVLTAMDGKTIEIGHTDAEGRLILADSIAYARKQGAEEIVTVATLTGAAMVALGRIHVPIMGDQKIVNRIVKGAQESGEKVWQLPLDKDHKNMVRGKFADLTNSDGTGEAGCITAGAFLAHFAEDTPFAHCDVSPSSYKPGAHDLGGAGATGMFVTTLVEAMS